MLLQDEIYRPHDPHSKLIEIFSKLLKEQPPIKNKMVRGSQAPFMTKEPSLKIKEKSGIRN